MRLLRHWFLTFVVLLPRKATSTSVIQTNVAARNLSTVSPRLETNASVASEQLKPQDCVADKNGDGHGKHEKRSFHLWSSLPDARQILGLDKLFSGRHLHPNLDLLPPMTNKETGIITAQFEKLGLRLQKLLIPGHSFRDDAWVKHLVESEREGELAELILRLRNIAGMESRAETMQRALLDEYPEALPRMSKVWFQSKLSPNEAYRMLPISVKRISLGAVGEKSEWPIIRGMIAYWLIYVLKHRSLGHEFSDDEVIRVLAGDRQVEEIQILINWLREFPGMKNCADRMQRSLELRLKFDAWLKLNVSPGNVYSLMPISAEKVYSAASGKKTSWSVILRKLKDWLDYVDKYRSLGHDFTEYQVVGVLRSNRRTDEVVQIFQKLRNVPGMKDRAERLLRCLELRPKFSAWLTSNLDPETVYSLMPIHEELSLSPTDREESSWSVLLSKLEEWLEYVDKYRSFGRDFSEYQEADALIYKRRSDEMMEIVHRLRDVPGIKDRAERLQRSLELRLNFDAWLESKLSPEEVYHRMGIPAMTRDVGTAGEEAAWHMLRYWLIYVRKYQSRYQGFSDDQAIDVLVGKREEQELVRFFNWLRTRTNMKNCADIMQRHLLFRSPAQSRTLNLMLGVWLESKVSPRVVYHIMFLPAGPNDMGAARENPERLQRFFAYVRDYRSAGKLYDDRQVFDLLKLNRPEEQAQKLFDNFKSESAL